MVHTVPLGRSQWLPLRPVPVYADGGKCSQSKGEASLLSFAGLRYRVRVVEVKMSSVNCHGYFLCQCEVSEQGPTRLDSLVAGASEMEGGCSRVVRLDVSLPLKLRVS